MKSIEEKAKEYLMNFPAESTFSIEEMIVNAFVAGAKSKEGEPVWRMGNDLLPLVDGAPHIELNPDDKEAKPPMTDWNQVRIQAAIAAMQAFISRNDCDLEDWEIATRAVLHANALIKELKNNKYE